MLKIVCKFFKLIWFNYNNVWINIVFLLDEKEVSVTNDIIYDHSSQKEDGKIAKNEKSGVVYYLLIIVLILTIIATFLNVVNSLFLYFKYSF